MVIEFYGSFASHTVASPVREDMKPKDIHREILISPHARADKSNIV